MKNKSTRQECYTYNSMSKDEHITQLLTKGVSEILPSKRFVESLLGEKKKLTIYVGVDPTGPTLHLGHAIQLRKLRQFQDLGHKIIFLIGDFTARIGDPTDKLAARTALTEKQVKENLKLYKKQASKFISFSGKNPAKVLFNNKWLGKLKFVDVLELASHMTVDQMLKRDMFARRIEEEKPIYIHEFMYPLMQGYDSVAMDVDGEVGGNDQLFNMLAGRTLLKKMKDKEKFVITVKLLEDTSGEKMGKTTGNMISFIDTPSDMYGKIMSWTDGMIVLGFELCTDYTMAQVATIKDELAKGINPRDIKMRLAYEIVKISTSEKEALAAEEHFISLFQKKDASQPTTEVTAQGSLKETLLASGLISSASELRTLASSGAIMSMTTRKKIVVDDLAKKPIPDTYRIGKHRFVKIS